MEVLSFYLRRIEAKRSCQDLEYSPSYLVRDVESLIKRNMVDRAALDEVVEVLALPSSTPNIRMHTDPHSVKLPSKVTKQLTLLVSTFVGRYRQNPCE